MDERVKLAGSGTPDANGIFEVVLITEGQGNGWNFSGKVLQESVKLWDGAECFVDHVGFFDSGHSVRDLGGVFYDVSFDEGAKGVKAKLKTLGPSGALVAQLGKEWLAETGAKPRVGFSADIGFKANGRDVVEISKVFSVDLVFEPARGGAFLRAINSVGGWVRQIQGGHMPEGQVTAEPTTVENADVAAARALLQVHEEKARIAKEIEQAREVRRQMCVHLLDAGLSASRLPAASQEFVRAGFMEDDGAGGKRVRVFDAVELQAAIDAQRNLVSNLTGAGAVAGVRSAVSGMFNSDDQLRLAVEDLLGVERDEKEKAVAVARLSGIRELYMGMQGDYDLYGGFYPERARFQHTTTTFAGLVKNALNKAIIRHWREFGKAGYDWWQNIVHVEHFDTLNTITWVIFGTVSSLPTVAEGAEYTELKLGDSPETTSFTKYGGYVGITLEAIDRDNTRKLRAAPRELALAGIRNISSLVAAIFTSNSGVGPTLADTGALFNSTAQTTAGGHKNLLTTALGTDYTAWDAVATAMYNQPMLVAQEAGYYGTGAKMAINPKYCLVPRALQAQAEALFLPRWASPIDTVQAAGGQTYGGYVVPVVVPEWTDTTDWAAVADPKLVPGICVGERFGLMPEIYIAGDEKDPAMFSNDESRIKVRHFIAVGVCDFRPLHKSNV